MSQERSFKRHAGGSFSGPLRRWLFGLGGLVVFTGLGWAVLQGFANRSSAPGPPATAPSATAAAGIGAAAPSVALPATTGGQLSLDRYRGSKVVLYFYEGAG